MLWSVWVLEILFNMLGSYVYLPTGHVEHALNLQNCTTLLGPSWGPSWGFPGDPPGAFLGALLALLGILLGILLRGPPLST